MSKVENNKNWFQRHTTITTIAATVGFFILLFTILSIGGGESNEDPLRVDNSNSSSESASQSDENYEVGVGETATRNNRALTISEVQRNYPGASEFSNPEAGKEFILVTITLENKGNDSFSFDSTNFKVQDSQGVQSMSKYVGEMDGEMDFGSLAPGGTVTGKLAYEVPEGDANLKLVYRTDMFNRDEVIVNLGE